MSNDLYVYRDEDNHAVAVARPHTGPNGGFSAHHIAQMALPGKRLTQDEIDGFAALFAAAPDMLEELERMVEHFSVFASEHSMDASTETWAALHCAKEVIRTASGHEPRHPAPSPSDAFAAWLNEGPKLAAAAGCYVGIKVSAATDEAP